MTQDFKYIAGHRRDPVAGHRKEDTCLAGEKQSPLLHPGVSLPSAGELRYDISNRWTVDAPYPIRFHLYMILGMMIISIHVRHSLMLLFLHHTVWTELWRCFWGCDCRVCTPHLVSREVAERESCHWHFNVCKRMHGKIFEHTEMYSTCEYTVYIWLLPRWL